MGQVERFVTTAMRGGPGSTFFEENGMMRFDDVGELAGQIVQYFQGSGLAARDLSVEVIRYPLDTSAEMKPLEEWSEWPENFCSLDDDEEAHKLTHNAFKSLSVRVNRGGKIFGSRRADIVKDTQYLVSIEANIVTAAPYLLKEFLDLKRTFEGAGDVAKFRKTWARHKFRLLFEAVLHWATSLHKLSEGVRSAGLASEFTDIVHRDVANQCLLRLVSGEPVQEEEEEEEEEEPPVAHERPNEDIDIFRTILMTGRNLPPPIVGKFEVVFQGNGKVQLRSMAFESL